MVEDRMQKIEKLSKIGVNFLVDFLPLKIYFNTVPARLAIKY